MTLTPIANDDGNFNDDSGNRSQLEPVEQPPRGEPRRKRNRNNHTLLSVTAPNAWEISGTWTPETVRDAQLKDPDIGPAVIWTSQGQRPPWCEVNRASPMLRSLWQQFNSLSIRDGILYRSFYDPRGNVQSYQLVLPKCLKAPFLELVHADVAGHLKFAKCVPHIARRAWWLYWKRDTRTFIKCCAKCEAFYRGKPPRQASLHPLPVGGPGEVYGIDLTGPHPASNGFKYLFTAVDLFTKFAVCVPMRNKEASTVAKCMVEHIFCNGHCHTRS